MNLSDLNSGERQELVQQLPGISPQGSARRNLTDVFENMEGVSDSFDDHTISEHVHSSGLDSSEANCLFYPNLRFNVDNYVFLMTRDDYLNSFHRLGVKNVYPIPLFDHQEQPLCEELYYMREEYYQHLIDGGHYIVIKTNEGSYSIMKTDEKINEILEHIYPHGIRLEDMEADDILEMGAQLQLFLVVVDKTYEVEPQTPVWQPDDLLKPSENISIEIDTRNPIRVFDSIELEEKPLNRFLHDSPDNYVFILLDERFRPASLAYTLSEEQITDMFTNKDFYFYCEKPSRGLYPRLSEIEQNRPLIRLPLGPVQIYVDAGKVLGALQSDGRIFAVSKQYSFPYTTSAESVRLSDSNYLNFRGQNIDGLGADHCQNDSDKALYAIAEVTTSLPPSLSGTPFRSRSSHTAETPDAVREPRTRLQSIERRMQEARQAGDQQMIVQLMRERQTLRG